MEDLPLFKIIQEYDPMTGDNFTIIEKYDFHKHLIEFITDNILVLNSDNQNYNEMLCYFINEDLESNLLEAKLKPSAYITSLNTCLKYFTKIEEYETCEKIIKLLKKVKTTI